MQTSISFEEVKQVVEKQLQQNPTGVLATAEDDHVTARTMALLPDGLTLSCFTYTGSRKFKQIEANKKVSIVVGNTIQIEGIAEIKGRTSDPQNAWFIEQLKNNMPGEMFACYEEELKDKNTLFQVIEIKPKRIAVFYGRPNAHLDVMNIDEETAVRYDVLDQAKGDYA